MVDDAYVPPTCLYEGAHGKSSHLHIFIRARFSFTGLCRRYYSYAFFTLHSGEGPPLWLKWIFLFHPPNTKKIPGELPGRSSHRHRLVEVPLVAIGEVLGRASFRTCAHITWVQGLRAQAKWVLSTGDVFPVFGAEDAAKGADP